MKKIYLYTITTLLLCSGATQAQNPLGFPYEREWATYLPNYFGTFKVRNDGSVLLISNIQQNTDSYYKDLISPDAYQPIFTSTTSGSFLGIINDNGKFEYGTYLNDFKDYTYVDVDHNNNFYLSGATLSQTGIATPGAYQQNLKGNEQIPDGAITLPDGSTVPPTIPLKDGFIVKFNAQTKKPEWGTYLNGDDGETNIIDIKFDRNSLYFLGYTSCTSGIATSDALFPNPLWKNSVIIGKMTADGKTLLWCTYMPVETVIAYDGGSRSFISFDLDTQGNIYYITHKSAYKLDKEGNLLKEYSDILDEGGMVHISQNDHIYISGMVHKETPILSTPGTYKTTKNTEYEYYLSCYNLDMEKQWGTYIAESNRSSVLYGFSFDRFNNPILIIETNKTELASSDAYQTSVQGKNDHLILSLNQDGQFNWATYYGGQREEYWGGFVGCSIGSESTKDILYFGGMTESPTMIATEDSAYPKKTNPAGEPISYLAKFVPLVTASVDKTEESDFVLWPNPATELLNLRSNTVLTEQSKLTIYDLKGKKVLAVKGEPANVQVINVSSLAQGSYILQVEDANNGINHSVKFVKKEQ